MKDIAGSERNSLLQMSYLQTCAGNPRVETSGYVSWELDDPMKVSIMKFSFLLFFCKLFTFKCYELYFGI